MQLFPPLNEEKLVEIVQNACKEIPDVRLLRRIHSPDAIPINSNLLSRGELPHQVEIGVFAENELTKPFQDFSADFKEMVKITGPHYDYYSDEGYHSISIDQGRESKILIKAYELMNQTEQVANLRAYVRDLRNKIEEEMLKIIRAKP